MKTSNVPSGWRSITLPELIAKDGVFIDGDWVESKDQDPAGNVRLIQLADIGEGSFLDKSDRFLTESKANELRCTYLLPGDILIARMPDPIGRACIFPGVGQPSVTVVDVCIVRPDQRVVDPAFLCRAINSDTFRSGINQFITGTTRQRISRGNLSKVEILLPPLAEQKRIAAVLDKADALRAKRRQALATLDTLLQSIFLDMFGDPVTNPKGWPKEPIESIVNAVTDCPHSTPRWTESGVIALRTSNLGKGDWIWTDTRYVSEAEYRDRSKRGELKAGDVVLSREGTVGIAAIVPPGLRMCMGQRLVQISPDRTKALSEYLLRVLLYELAPERISHVMAGSTSKHLNVSELRELMVPKPPVELQSQFQRTISGLEKAKTDMEFALQHLEVLFASLQSAAFSGTLFSHDHPPAELRALVEA